MPATPEPTLMSQVTEDITNVRMFSGGMTFKLALVSHEGLKLSLARFNRRPLLPSTFNQAVHELSKEEKGGMVIAPDCHLWTKAAHALTQL